MSKESLFDQIREVVKEIPMGKVATYGDIAAMVGISDARKVGWALKGNVNPAIPCHRVLKADGWIAHGFAFGNWQEQRIKLEKEGVVFLKADQVDLPRHRWQVVDEL